MAVYLAAKGYKNKSLLKGVKYLGIAEDGVGLAIDENTKKLVPKKLLSEIKKLQKKISEGKLVIKDMN